MKQSSKQQHKLKKYLEFTVNKKPDKMKKHKNVCKRTDRNFLNILLLKKDAQLVINDNREQGLNFENFCWGLCYQSLSQNDLNPERFFSSLKETIVLYLVKKFETFMVIFTSGRRCVFFKKTIFYISFTDNPFNTEFTSICAAAYWTASFWIVSDEISFWFVWWSLF